MKKQKPVSISLPMIALAIPLTILFQNCSPGDMQARNALVRSKADVNKAAWADFKR